MCHLFNYASRMVNQHTAIAVLTVVLRYQKTGPSLPILQLALRLGNVRHVPIDAAITFFAPCCDVVPLPHVRRFRFDQANQERSERRDRTDRSHGCSSIHSKQSRVRSFHRYVCSFGKPTPVLQTGARRLSQTASLVGGQLIIGHCPRLRSR